ncbi:hypothetical protein ACK8HX_07485 [Oryzobacter sp. R7]|uniref:hypothetical protein n=1 Tax=Oryzobacter faecalis TaxID=3388656 RepID=UPI00398D255D
MVVVEAWVIWKVSVSLLARCVAVGPKDAEAVTAPTFTFGVYDTVGLATNAPPTVSVVVAVHTATGIPVYGELVGHETVVVVAFAQSSAVQLKPMDPVRVRLPPLASVPTAFTVMVAVPEPVAVGVTLTLTLFLAVMTPLADPSQVVGTVRSLVLSAGMVALTTALLLDTWRSTEVPSSYTLFPEPCPWRVIHTSMVRVVWTPVQMLPRATGAWTPDVTVSPSTITLSARAAPPPAAMMTDVMARVATARTRDIGLIGPPLTVNKWSPNGKAAPVTCADEWRK